MDTDFIELVAALKTGADAIKGLLSFSDLQDSDVREKIHELNAALMSAQSYALQAQSKQAELLAEREGLISEVDMLRTFEEEKKKYQLMRIGRSIVYGLRDELVSSETQHYLCPNCFADGKKSFLQRVGYFQVCSRCGLKGN